MFDGVSWPTQEEHYYDGAGRLVLIERHGGLGADSIGHVEDNDLHMLTEWYRYDALGRRVLVFTNHNVQAFCDIEGCESTLSRYVWAGDQLLYETRAPAADSLTSSTIETDTPSGDGEYGLPKAYGTVGYTHAGGIDRPLGVMRMNSGGLTTAFYPQLNWRGLYETATTDTGTQFSSRDYIKWPGAVASAYLGATTKPDSAFWWYGSQITESADASGLMYRRNRYYDPASGRFTQPDPAGVGGGLNAYGFASGDPVNYADPFGLCPCTSGGGGFAGGGGGSSWSDDPKQSSAGGTSSGPGVVTLAAVSLAEGEKSKGASQRADSSGSSSVGGVTINMTKQRQHIYGTKAYANRVKQGKPTSAFYDLPSSLRLTNEAWLRGTPVRGDPNKRDFDFGYAVGIGPNGGTQTRVRVHRDSRNQIHGHPSGPESN